MAHLRVLSRFLYEYGWGKFRTPQRPDDERFIRAAYRAFFEREPDEQGLHDHLNALQSRHITRAALIAIFMHSPEFARRYVVPSDHTLVRIRDLQRLVEQEHRQLARELRRKPDDELFVRAVYRALLRREPDADGVSRYVLPLQQRCLSRRAVLREIIDGNEFRQVYGLSMHPLEALHRARMALFQQHLPPAAKIVDLGGAAHNQAHGALLMMGYPHHPQEILIVDLPPAERIGGRTMAEAVPELVTNEGTRITYLYRSMAQLDDIATDSTDLVVSGESIEHITEEEADIVCREAYRILKPGGFFCLDTPNAALTRIESPDKFIHPEHQKEYYVHELRDKLERSGFVIVDEKGICPMPESLRSGQFYYGEMVQNADLSDNAEAGYLFFLKAVKPA